ncbi:hypothetical protein CSH63_25720 [Micromonospora tulbaghiae]|uniref:Uncharacterized protein n=1 Tax=Micromonospora tulbaghiae TaxID=479978 RepID=A0A386WT44_9ACTN|nr:hypothetical protein CSH63_25720 [Micromonospora tulbaghiae]
MPRERLSVLAALPDDVIDPLLWRLAFDVVAAHQPNERGNCRNLQCVGQRGMCAAARAARRAMALARSSSPTASRTQPARGRATVVKPSQRDFAGWFATRSPLEVTRPVSRSATLPRWSPVRSAVA